MTAVSFSRQSPPYLPACILRICHLAEVYLHAVSEAAPVAAVSHVRQDCVHSRDLPPITEVSYTVASVSPVRQIVFLNSLDMPRGTGVSSSAALEVAAMTAVAGAVGVSVQSSRIALLCQQVHRTYRT